MKKIICTVTNDLNFDQRMIRICTSLSNAGYEVQLVGRKLKYSPALADQPFLQKRFNLFFNHGKLFYLEFNFRLIWFLLFTGFDAVCSVDLDTLLAGFLVSKLKSKKIIYDAHEYFTEVPEVVERPMVKGAWEFLARSIIPRLKYCYTVSECIAEDFRDRYNSHFLVIRNVPVNKKNVWEKHGDSVAYSNARSFWRPNLKPFILIYQGVLNEGRGLEEILSAMEKLIGVELWLVGEGDLSSELRKTAKDKGMLGKVVFHGRIAPDELHALTVKSHLGLNLLKNKGLNYYYSLANKTFDYMQAGIPSICMDFPEYKKINKEYSVFYLLEKLEIESLVKAINKFKDDKNFYINKCKSNRIAADVFVWEKEEIKLIEFYKKVME